MGWWSRISTRLIAADPGMRRLRSAIQMILAVLLAAAVTLPLLLALGQPPVAIAAAALVAMTGLLAVRTGSNRERITTILLLPVVVVAAIGLGVLTGPWPPLGEVVFLVVMFGAVYVRRFGGRAGAAGLVGFLGYFVALLLRVPASAIPAMAGAGMAGAAAAVLVRFLLLPERPEAAWRSGVRALLARVRTLRHGMAALVEQPESAQRSRRVRDELLRLNATALALGSGFAALDTVPPERADELRGRVLDVELAAGAQVVALDGVLDERTGADTTAAVLGRVGEALDGEIGGVARICRDVADFADGFGAPALGMAVRRLASTSDDLEAAIGALKADGLDVQPDPTAADTEPVEPPATAPPPVEPPSVAQAPGNPAPEPVSAVRKELLPTTRTAVQVAVAGALAMFFGGLVSPGQWFWAVITAFVVFIGAASRGELLVRAWSRAAGTLGGMVAGVLVASVVAGHPVVQVTVVLCCVFLAFYLLPVSYGLMTFFVTTMLGVVYGLIGRFSIGYLEIRLAETLVGAVCGAVAALFVLPTRTRGVVSAKLTDFFGAIADALRAATAELVPQTGPAEPAATARTVDDRMHAVLASASPLGSFRVGAGRARHERGRQLVSACAAATRELARTVPLAAATSDADTRARLGDLTATLAELADALAARDFAATGGLIERAAALEGTLVDLIEALHAGSTALRVTVHLLGRLRGALADIAVELGASPPPAGAGRRWITRPGTAPARSRPAA